MKKTKLLSFSFMTAFSCAAFALASTAAFNPIASKASSCDHVGNHYTALDASLLESGTNEYYICCKCHQVILGDAHVEGDGVWTDAGQAARVSKEHAAYLEPTVTAADVNAKAAALGDSLAINVIPSTTDKTKLQQFELYRDVYLSKNGTSEDDLTGLENYRGLQNVFNEVSSAKVAGASDIVNGRRVIYAPTKATVSYSLSDVENCVDYAKLEINAEISKYSSAAFIYGSVLTSAAGSAQVLVRTNFDTSFHVYGGGVRSASAFSVPANIWTAISVTSEQIAAIATKVAAGDYNTCYLSNNTVLSVGQTIEISGVYSVSRTNLGDYTLLSNEGYSTLWTAGGLTGALSTNLHNNVWFADAGTPAFHPDYRDYFLETKMSNASGADKSCSDLLVSNSYYGGLYFNVGTNNTFSATPTEVFFMVYANEEANIKYSNFGDIVRKGSEKQVLKETKIYKGWNFLHLNIDKENPKAYSFKGHTLSIVPETWTTTLELTMATMFYK